MLNITNHLGSSLTVPGCNQDFRRYRRYRLGSSGVCLPNIGEGDCLVVGEGTVPNERTVDSPQWVISKGREDWKRGGEGAVSSGGVLVFGVS